MIYFYLSKRTFSFKHFFLRILSRIRISFNTENRICTSLLHVTLHVQRTFQRILILAFLE